MKSNFINGFVIFIISIIIISCDFDVPYKLNFQSLSENINFENFDLISILKLFIILLLLSCSISVIPFSKRTYLDKFSRVFLILNLIFLIFSIYNLVDTTIVGSKISCEYHTPNL